MKKHIQTQEEWEVEMSLKVLDYVRHEIYLDLRFLNTALSALAFKNDRTVQTFATDGSYLCFSTEQILRVFQQNPLYLDRLYLHTVLHCIFSHLWVMPGNIDSGDYRRFWHLACDIAVEYVIDGTNKPCTRRILSGLRQMTYEKIKQEI